MHAPKPNTLTSTKFKVKYLGKPSKKECGGGERGGGGDEFFVLEI